MNSLVAIVKEKRIENYQKFKNMAEDYVKKSEEVLNDYLKKHPEKAQFSKIAIPITGIDFTKGTVDIKNDVYGLWPDEEYESYGFENLEDVDVSTTYILEREYEIAEIQPFMEVLRDFGFCPLVHDLDKYEKIYPFFSIN